jgi:hypothetical protein
MEMMKKISKNNKALAADIKAIAENVSEDS